MYSVVAGVAVGAVIGAANNCLLRRALAAGRVRDADVGHLAAAFRIRYAALVLVLLGFWLCTHSAAGEVALALAAVVSSRFLLLRTFPMGGDQP